MSQSDLVPALLSLVGKEVEFLEHPGATPVIGKLTKDEGLSFFEVTNGENKARFHYLGVDVLVANEVMGNKDTICNWVSEGFK